MSETLQLIIVAIGISTATCQCASVDTLASTDGMACQPFEYQNITASKREFCSLACVQINHCDAVIYDNTLGVCMLMKYPCFSLTPHFDHVYQSHKGDCTIWVLQDDNHRAYWYIQSGQQRSYVARQAHDGNVIIGKKLSVSSQSTPLTELEKAPVLMNYW